MNFHIKKSTLFGSVNIPGSKSHTIRGIICGTLAKGKTTLTNALISDDTMACVAACEAFGARISIDRKKAKIIVTGTNGSLKTPDNIIDVMNSGTTLYFTMGMAALSDGWTFFTGDHQIRNRPAGEMMKILKKLGCRTFSSRENKKAPLAVKGRARGGRVSVHAKSSQYLSSLLLCAPMLAKKTEIKVVFLNEKPYVDMTLSWLKACGVKIKEKENNIYEVIPKQKFCCVNKKIPSDFSSAAFFIAAAALFAHKKVCIKGLDMKDVQGDKAIVPLLKKMGADIKIKKDSLTITHRPLKGIRIDIKDTPDLLPILSVVACYCSGETVIYNGEHVREKETDRISVMSRELKKMGAGIKETKDGMIIKGEKLRSASLLGHDDHRVIMSLAVASMGCDGQSTVKGIEAVSVTFPNFYDLMKSLKAKISIDLHRATSQSPRPGINNKNVKYKTYVGAVRERPL